MGVETMGDWLQLYNIGLTGLNGLSAPDSGLRSPVLRSPWVGPIPILVNTGSVKKKIQWTHLRLFRQQSVNPRILQQKHIQFINFIAPSIITFIY